jgi:hypothetical protein
MSPAQPPGHSVWSELDDQHKHKLQECAMSCGTLGKQQPEFVPRVCVCWVFLCTLGIEAAKTIFLGKQWPSASRPCTP